MNRDADRLRVSNSTSPKKRLPRWVTLLGCLLAIAVLVGGFRLYATLSEVGLTGLLHGGGGAGAIVHLKEQPVYKVKKRQDLLGINVVRIISRQQPEEFLVLSNVSDGLTDQIFGKNVDLGWANLTAGQLVKLRGNHEDAAPVSVEIQKIHTLKSGTLESGGRKLPYWELEIRFKLSNESDSRIYQAGVVRDSVDGDQQDASAKANKPGKPDFLVVGYAQKGAYDKALVSDLLTNLTVESPGHG